MRFERVEDELEPDLERAVTYLLAGLRSITSEGWRLEDIVPALLAVTAVGVVSQALAFTALRSRVRRD